VNINAIMATAKGYVAVYTPLQPGGGIPVVRSVVLWAATGGATILPMVLDANVGNLRSASSIVGFIGICEPGKDPVGFYQERASLSVEQASPWAVARPSTSCRGPGVLCLRVRGVWEFPLLPGSGANAGVS
jgi:hypothetical protein